MSLDFQCARPLLQCGNLTKSFMQELGWETSVVDFVMSFQDWDEMFLGSQRGAALADSLAPGYHLPAIQAANWNEHHRGVASHGPNSKVFQFLFHPRSAWR